MEKAKTTTTTKQQGIIACGKPDDMIDTVRYLLVGKYLYEFNIYSEEHQTYIVEALRIVSIKVTGNGKAYIIDLCNEVKEDDDIHGVYKPKDVQQLINGNVIRWNKHDFTSTSRDAIQHTVNDFLQGTLQPFSDLLL